MSKLFLCLLIFASACSAFPSTAPTPVIIVVTATPNTIATVTPIATPNAQPTRSTDATNAPAPATTNSAFPTKPTAVKYVQAKQDINIRKGPSTNYDIVGGVYAGQTAQVTGVSSADGQWWRVLCPDGSIGDCWVSADPALTEPAQPPNTAPPQPTTLPNAEPTQTPAAASTLDAFTQQLADALENKNYDALRQTMGDPFTIGYWRSEGTEPSRDEALVLIKSWLAPAANIEIDRAGRTDQIQLLAGTNPLGMWNPQVKVVKSLYVKGLADNREALLILARRADGSYYWYGMLLAGRGGFEALNQ